MRAPRRPVTPEEQEEGKRLAEQRLESPAWGRPQLQWDEDLGLPVPSLRREDVSFCGAWMWRSQKHCGMPEGAATSHLGVGACWKHDTGIERATGAWIVAHAMARIQDITPWEALLLAVKRAAAWVAFYESKVAEATDDDDLRPGGDLHDWVMALERVNDKLARYSKMAVDAGVAQMLVTRARTEGETIARVLNSALGDAGLSDEQETRLRGALRRALLEVEDVHEPGTPARASAAAGASAPVRAREEDDHIMSPGPGSVVIDGETVETNGVNDGNDASTEDDAGREA